MCHCYIMACCSGSVSSSSDLDTKHKADVNARDVK